MQQRLQNCWKFFLNKSFSLIEFNLRPKKKNKKTADSIQMKRLLLIEEKTTNNLEPKQFWRISLAQNAIDTSLNDVHTASNQKLP